MTGEKITLTRRKSAQDLHSYIAGVRFVPMTDEEVEEWNGFEDRYNIPVYFDILPREMSNKEFKRRVKEIYDLGARRIALWDTYGRVYNIPMWNLVSRFGHKDEIDDIPIHEEGHKIERVVRLEDVPFKRASPFWGG